MEGPYLNPKFGCDREKNTWKGEINKADYAEIIKKVKDHVKVWCISPERDGIEDFVHDVKASIPNIVFTVAHSEATPQQVENFIPEGLKIGTHHTNATGTLFKYSECRGVCVDEAVNYNDDIYSRRFSGTKTMDGLLSELRLPRKYTKLLFRLERRKRALYIRNRKRHS